MAEDSAFWGGTTVGDAASADVWQAPYTSEEWSDIWSKMFASDSASGFVIPLHENELAVEAENPVSMDVSVLSGVAQVRGRLYENTTTATLTIAANASGSPRIDRVILRTSFAAQTIRLAVLQGTPGGVPALPALTQDANTWEISLAYIWVANGAASIPDEEIHDERLFLKTSLSHKYEAGSLNLIRNSEFMGFSELSGGATTNPPDGWSLEATPSDIASATKYSGMPRGRAIQVTTNAALEGIYQSFFIPANSPYCLKLPVQVTAGDVGVVQVPISYSATSYANSNQDISVPLRGPSGAGAVVGIIATGTTVAVGNLAGNQWQAAQSFQITAGRLATIKYTLAASVGTPVGDMKWEICANNAGAPGTVLQSGTNTPTAGAGNTVTVADGIFLAAATTYWLKLYPNTSQSLGNYWQWTVGTPSVYASGNLSQSTDGGSTWIPAATYDANCEITTIAVSVGDKLAQSFQVSETVFINIVRLYLKKAGAPAGTMTLRIETNNAGSPSGSLVDAAATTTLAEASLGTSFASVDFTFASSFTLSSGTTYWIVLSTDRASSATNYVLWGSDASSPGYTLGEMKSEATGSWSAESKDACFDILYSSTTTKYIRRTGSFIEESLYFPSVGIGHQVSVQLLGLNNGDVIQFGQCLLLEGRHPGPFREIHETILFKDGITDTNWAADSKSDGTTTIDLDSDFQALVLPGTRQVLLGLIAQEVTDDVLTFYATSNQDTGVQLQGAAGIDKIAQSFQVVGAQTVNRVKLYIKKVGSPVGALTLRLETDTAGSPSGTLVSPSSYSEYVYENLVGTNYSLVIFTLLSSTNISGATTYWLVLSTDRASDASNYILWGADGSAPSYASGQMKSQNSSVWSAESKDGCFSVLKNTALTSYLAARYVGGTKDYVKVSCESGLPLLDYYEQGWVKLNINNQFDLYVVDTAANSIVCSARILGIEV